MSEARKARIRRYLASGLLHTEIARRERVTKQRIGQIVKQLQEGQ